MEGSAEKKGGPSVSSIRARVQALRRPRANAGWRIELASMDRQKLLALGFGSLAVIGVLASLFGQAFSPISAALAGFSLFGSGARQEPSQLAAVGALGQPKPRGGRSPVGFSEADAEDAARFLTPDVFKALPDEFDPSYKTPCWVPNGTEDSPGRRHCIPFYYVLGNWQSGTRDLQLRLELHPDVVRAGNNAPHYWDERHPFEQYLRNFDQAVPFIEAAPDRAVVGDASASTFAFTWTASERLHEPWITAVLKCREDCKQQQPCIQDRCYKEASEAYPPLSGGGAGLTMPYYLRRVTGKNVRLVILLRDPTERFHTSFWFYEHYQKKYGATEEGFAVYAAEMTSMFQTCLLKGHGKRMCALAFEALGQEFEDVFFHCDQLIKSMYSMFMGDWLDAFPREDVLVLRYEDYSDQSLRRGVLEQVFKHLMLANPTEEQWRAIMAKPFVGERAPETQMDPGTRGLLRAFYSQFNTELARQLGDSRFEWIDPQEVLSHQAADLADRARMASSHRKSRA